MTLRLRFALLVLPLLALGLAGCEGPISAFQPASREAADVHRLYWIMTIGGTLIWLAVIGLAIYATRVRPGPHSPRTVKMFLIGGGIVLPVLVLAALLAYGLVLLPPLQAAQGDLRLRVVGERWWWRVHYQLPGNGPVASANEIRLPAGELAVLLLESPEVIHSFWAPNLGGKLDLIPGRINQLVVQPTRTGVFRGACAEYCGTGHANMQFAVEVMPPEAFRRWLAGQADPAVDVETPLAQRGAQLFLDRGCGNCHAVRGTPARGSFGPDLTHLADRHTIGAGRLPMTPEALQRWIRHAEGLKPGVQMPSYPLPEQDLEALASYLSALQ